MRLSCGQLLDNLRAGRIYSVPKQLMNGTNGLLPFPRFAYIELHFSGHFVAHVQSDRKKQAELNFLFI